MVSTTSEIFQGRLGDVSTISQINFKLSRNVQFIVAIWCRETTTNTIRGILQNIQRFFGLLIGCIL